MAPRKKPQAVAYSYLRFSSAEQAKGDSIRRQTKLRDDWLAKSGAMLDTSLTLTDAGVSGYTGQLATHTLDEFALGRTADEDAIRAAID